MTCIQSCLEKISQRSAFFVKILRFKVRSTKMKVNNENGSDVSSDKTAENAVIVGRKRKIKKVSTYLNLGLIYSPRTLVFKMD